MHDKCTGAGRAQQYDDGEQQSSSYCGLTLGPIFRALRRKRGHLYLPSTSLLFLSPRSLSSNRDPRSSYTGPFPISSIVPHCLTPSSFSSRRSWKTFPCRQSSTAKQCWIRCAIPPSSSWCVRIQSSTNLTSTSSTAMRWRWAEPALLLWNREQNMLLAACQPLLPLPS